MLTTMVAGPVPTAYCENAGGRHAHQVLDVPPPHGYPLTRPQMGRQLYSPSSQPPHSNYSNTITTSSANATSSASNPTNQPTSSTLTSTRSTTTTNGSGTLVPDVCHQQQYTPPLSGPMSQPQGPPPPYCPQEYITGDPYYPGPPPEYCSSVCTLQHGVPGPATVRMVSTNSSPPIPLPVQMPPGHVVQQIVDESGTLQHVILSAQPVPLCPYGPSAGQGPPQFYSPPPGPPPQGYMTSYQPGPQYPHVMSPPLTQPSPPPPHNYQKNDRNARQHEKIRTKFYQRHQTLPHHHYQPPPHQQLHLKTHTTNSIQHTPPLSPKKELSLQRKSEEAEGMNGDATDNQHISLQELISHIKSPEISEIGPYNATVQWLTPDVSSLASKGVMVSDLLFEVFLNNSIYDTVPGTHIELANLRPGTEYNLYLICLCNGVRGYATPKQTFHTKPTVPDPPQPPRIVDRKKQSLSLKWNPPKDNGSRIQHYNLEVFGGHFGGSWTQVYQNRNREFSLTKLKPQTTYRFRISACNEVGDSDYSPEMFATTVGLVPSQPPPPTLEEATVSSLTLSWGQRPTEDTFALEMEDSFNDYGFRSVFCGSETHYTCLNLRRNSDYKFRLCRQNLNGKSPFSEIVCYRTQPDLPQPPSAPIMKGSKQYPDRLFITWSPPVDHGGSPVTSYVVQIDRGNGFDTIYSGPKLDCDVSGLSPGTPYRIRCLAETAGGKSKWSPEGVLTTKPVAPGQCNVPRLVGNPKANSLQLTWGYPDYDGGSPVTDFQMDMMTPDTDRKVVYTGREEECTVDSLLPGRAYIFLLRASNVVGPGLWSEPFEVVSGAGPPDAPKAPHLACKGPNVVMVTWDEPINNGARIEQYVVQVAEVSCPSTESTESAESSTYSEFDSELTYSIAHTGPNSQAEIKGLTPATTYAFKVCASNTSGTGSYSPAGTVSTPAAPPAPVAHITSQSEASEVTLSWTEPFANGDPVTHYNIEYGDGKVVSTTDPILEYTVGGLSPETTYKFRIQAVNSVGCGPFSGAHKASTQPLPPSAPRVELVKASYNCLRLKWGDGRNLELLKYFLEMQYPNPHTNTIEFYQVYSGMNQSYKIGRLEEDTTYVLRICASNKAGIGPYSLPVEYKTNKAPPATPKAPRVTEEPAGVFTAEWCPIRCPGEDRIVYRTQLLLVGKDQDYSLVQVGSETSCVMRDLPPDTRYYVRVCGVRMCGEKEVVAGGYSSPTLFNTPRKEVETTIVKPRNTNEKISFQWKTLTDHQKALAIIVGFSIMAFLAAYLLSPAGVR